MNYKIYLNKSYLIAKVVFNNSKYLNFSWSSLIKKSKYLFLVYGVPWLVPIYLLGNASTNYKYS